MKLKPGDYVWSDQGSRYLVVQFSASNALGLMLSNPYYAIEPLVREWEHYSGEQVKVGDDLPEGYYFTQPDYEF